jgi:hypothetical protein
MRLVLIIVMKNKHVTEFPYWFKTDLKRPVYQERLDPPSVAQHLIVARRVPYSGGGMAATKLDGVLTGYSGLKVDGDVVTMDLCPGVWPKKSLREYFKERVVGQQTAYLHANPLLSSVIHGVVYQGKERDLHKPDHVIIQKRGEGTDQGSGIQWMAAGMVDWPEEPYRSAIRETKEEANVFVSLIDKNDDGELVDIDHRQPKRVPDSFFHFIGSDKLLNLNFVFVGTVCYEVANRNFRVVENYSDIIEQSDGEVAGCYMVPTEKLVPLFREAAVVGADFSDSLRTMENLSIILSE